MRLESILYLFSTKSTKIARAAGLSALFVSAALSFGIAVHIFRRKGNKLCIVTVTYLYSLGSFILRLLSFLLHSSTLTDDIDSLFV